MINSTPSPTPFPIKTKALQSFRLQSFNVSKSDPAGV